MKYHKSTVMIMLLIIISTMLLSKIHAVKDDNKSYENNIVSIQWMSSPETEEDKQRKQRAHEKELAKDAEELAIKLAKDKENLERELANKRNTTILIIAGAIVISALIFKKKGKQKEK